MNSPLRLVGMGVLAVVCCFLVAGISSADGPGSYLSEGGCHGVGAWDYFYLPRSTYTHDYIPYFAKHPPVYYSYPVPRTYGYSPYAYPPSVRTPEVEFVEPVTIRNPYVPKSETRQKRRADQVTRQPLRIRNPFVEQSDVSGLAKLPERKPQVVYPASLGKSPRGAN
jgi:hypothetical protein